MIDFILFMIRFIPFWAVPLLVVSLEFTYIYWLKSLIRYSICFALTAFISLIFILFYFWAGTPEHAARLVGNLFLG